MKKPVVIGLLILIVLAAGGAAVVLMNKKDTPTTSQTTTSSSGADSPSALQPSTNTSEQKAPAATITYTDDGFSPSKTTVHAGDVVKVVNNSSHNLQFSSDPHPIHTKDEELNQQTLQPGQSQTFDVTKKGTFGFHDHLDATKTGTIVIE